MHRDPRTDEPPPLSLAVLHKTQEPSPGGPYFQEDAETSEDAQSSVPSQDWSSSSYGMGLGTIVTLFHRLRD